MNADLGRRAVACKHWRWMPGMRVVYAHGDTDTLDEGLCGNYGCPLDWQKDWSWLPALPVLTDPATLGCLLALVREAWEEPTICTAYADEGDGRPWGCGAELIGWADIGWHATEASALVAALEAAP